MSKSEIDKELTVEYRIDLESGLLCKEENGTPFVWSAKSESWEAWYDTAIRVFNGMDKSKPCTESEAMEIVKNGYPDE